MTRDLVLVQRVIPREGVESVPLGEFIVNVFVACDPERGS
jgi:hypothetical protein